MVDEPMTVERAKAVLERVADKPITYKAMHEILNGIGETMQAHVKSRVDPLLERIEKLELRAGISADDADRDGVAEMSAAAAIERALAKVAQ